jgi:hypothetical protein
MNTNTKTINRLAAYVQSHPFCSDGQRTHPSLQMDITKEIWKDGRREMEKLIPYVKEIELFDGI